MACTTNTKIRGFDAMRVVGNQYLEQKVFASEMLQSSLGDDERFKQAMQTVARILDKVVEKSWIIGFDVETLMDNGVIERFGWVREQLALDRVRLSNLIIRGNNPKFSFLVQS
jgi:hypothetical protein